MKKSQFSTEVALYRKWYKICSQWLSGRKSYTIERRQFSMIPRLQVSRSRHYLTLNISKTVRDTCLCSKWELQLTQFTPYSRLSFRMTLSDNDSNEPGPLLTRSCFLGPGQDLGTCGCPGPNVEPPLRRPTSRRIASFLPRDAMHKRGLCRHAVYMCLSCS